MEKPVLRDFSRLSAADFDEHPVWIGSHTADYDEPWYDETTEETFRPWTGPLPVARDDGMLLVRAEATLSDGSRLDGFVTPATDDDIGIMQPHVFVGERVFGFWRTPEAVRQEFRTTLGKDDADVFPIRVIAGSGLVRGGVNGTVADWLPSTITKRLKGLFGGGA